MCSVHHAFAKTAIDPTLWMVQLGRYGGLADELDNLKRDRVLLVEELKRQRQRQQVNFKTCIYTLRKGRPGQSGIVTLPWGLSINEYSKLQVKSIAESYLSI